MKFPCADRMSILKNCRTTSLVFTFCFFLVFFFFVFPFDSWLFPWEYFYSTGTARILRAGMCPHRKFSERKRAFKSFSRISFQQKMIDRPATFVVISSKMTFFHVLYEFCQPVLELNFSCCC